MTDFEIRGPNGTIDSLGAWFAAAPPQDASQWVDCGSAKELARAWCRGSSPAPPAEFLDVLGARPETAGFVAELASAEHVTRLDNFRGMHRHHDLVVAGTSGERRVTVGVEAKAGEGFGSATAAATYGQGRSTLRSNIPKRVALLIEALTGEQIDTASPTLAHPLGARGYQLLTASVGTIIEAQQRGCALAVFLVHEFVCAGASVSRVEGRKRAHADLEAWLDVVSGGLHSHLGPGELAGPFETHQTDNVTGDVLLLVGACETTLS